MSEEGRSLPSTILPERSTTTRSSAVSFSYSTPLGLMAMTPRAASSAETFPKV